MSRLIVFQGFKNETDSKRRFMQLQGILIDPLPFSLFLEITSKRLIRRNQELFSVFIG